MTVMLSMNMASREDMTMNAMKKGGSEPIKVTVSNTVARDNICSLAKKRKRTATAQRVGDDFVIEIA